jgi:hypothetical protein
MEEDYDPFADLEKLRCPQDYIQYAAEQAIISAPIRTLRDGSHLRVNPDPANALLDVFFVERPEGLYLVPPQFREALKAVCKFGSFSMAVCGDGTYHLLLTKQTLPEQILINEWHRTARIVREPATQGWIKVTKPAGNTHWSYTPLPSKSFEPVWPKDFTAMLKAAFPDRVVDRIDHALIKHFEEHGA